MRKTFTLYEYSKQFITEKDGTFHVDLKHDRSRLVDRLEPSSTDVGAKAASGRDHVDQGQAQPDVVWPTLSGNECRILIADDIEAEQAFFSMQQKPVNVIVPCSSVIDARTGKDITNEPHVRKLYMADRPLCMCKSICRGANPGVRCRGLK